jgi:hypothetical protein
MRRERVDHTLQTAAITNEKYLRLVDIRHIQWQDRAHFFAMAARLMRRILGRGRSARRFAKSHLLVRVRRRRSIHDLREGSEQDC